MGADRGRFRWTGEPILVTADTAYDITDAGLAVLDIASPATAEVRVGMWTGHERRRGEDRRSGHHDAVVAAAARSLVALVVRHDGENGDADAEFADSDVLFDDERLAWQALVDAVVAEGSRP